MKKLISAAAFAACITASAHAAVIINEVYAGGGSTSASAAFKTDYVELFNTGTTSVDVTGFKLAYGSSASTAGTFGTAIGTLSGSIAPGGFLLIQTGSSGTGGANDVTPDFDFNTGASLSATAGAIRLSDASSVVLDIVGYGAVNNFETAPATAPAAPNSLQRTGGVDTDNNSVDFISAAATPMATVPEPTSMALLGLGMAGMALRRQRRSA